MDAMTPPADPLSAASLTHLEGKREGPRITIKASCLNCVHESSESYRVQGDSGHDVYCNVGSERRHIGDTTWNTPKWCPFLAQAIAASAPLPEVPQ